MTMFASLAREDTEPDCPYYQRTGNQKCNRGCWQEPSCITDEPFGGWLKPQHNPPNFRLVAFRQEVEFHAEDPEWGLSLTHLARLWVDRNYGADDVSEAEFHHSQKILTRLANLTTEGA